MNAQRVSAGRGARWLAEGWRMFRASPLGWFVLVFGYWVAMTILSLVPVIGIGVAVALTPAVSVGFMAASRAAARGQPVELAMLAAGFRERLPAPILQLVRRRFRIRAGQHGKRHQAIGVLPDGGVQPVVGAASDGDGGRGVQALRGGRAVGQDLHVDAGLVHLPDAQRAEVVQPLVQRLVLHLGTEGVEVRRDFLVPVVFLESNDLHRFPKGNRPRRY